MGENSGWDGLAGNYSQDNASQAMSQGMGSILAGAGTGYAQPSITGQVQAMGGYGGIVQPSSVNGYPMFSSGQAGAMSPSGYAATNPVGATPSMIAAQARGMQNQPAPMNPAAPTPAMSNPWNIVQSSGPGDAMGYPTGRQAPLPKINTL